MTQTIPTTRESAAVDEFVEVWAKSGLAFDVAGSLTCREADALANLLAIHGHHDAAASWIEQHGQSDDEGDAHCHGATTEYIVPVDPMDALQCDSCQ